MRSPSSEPSPPTLWSRRDWLTRLGWAGVLVTLGTAVVAFVRLMYPRVLFEPPPAFSAGKVDDYLPGTISERFRAGQRVWIARTDTRVIAIFARCTHLGCTPRWLASENKFKCPCHGSGFLGFGPGGTEGDLAVHFEGPAPRPLERLKVTVDAEGRLLVDKSVRFRSERGEWEKPGSFVEV